LGVGGLNSLSFSLSATGVIGALQTTSDAVDRWRARKGRPDHFYPLQLPPPSSSSSGTPSS
jgi:hypothetical protein